MPAADVPVKCALAAQQDLISRREHCSADQGTLVAIGRAVGQQVRIARNRGEFGLYTVSEIEPDDPGVLVRMGLAGRERLGTSAEFNGVIDATVTRSELTEHAAETRGELIERLDDDGAQSGLIVIAPHGGDIEPNTDRQAERVAARLGVSSWRCLGWRPGGGAFERWHITSTDLSEASFPGLASVISRGFAHAVAFHGFGEPEILIGGTAPDSLKQEISTAIATATAGSGITVRIAQPGEGFGGDDPRNLVNRLTAGGASGVQIEQSRAARDDHWAAIADAVAEVYAGTLAQSGTGAIAEPPLV